ncbi:hypothetical protein [Gloeobacter morelensis]|uniref:Transposase n=1 Tax=Gloeobacter morelensis MG652769 TaxID=2781736 RepID=A0ABY3PSD8_9CYAN|nr:hypothetical protein [Gloeobacter morelensis]UFP96638.1 hypothetical protein ISF26_10695 [Gloeobacter morelensis MG652769]
MLTSLNNTGTERNFEYWTPRRKVKVVLDLLKGNATVFDLARKYKLPPSEIKAWLFQAEMHMENGFRNRTRDAAQLHEAQLTEAHAALGKALLRARFQRTPPTRR